MKSALMKEVTPCRLYLVLLVGNGGVNKLLETTTNYYKLLRTEDLNYACSV